MKKKKNTNLLWKQENHEMKVSTRKKIWVKNINDSFGGI